ncbi:MAG: hypothetical protein JJ913_09780 [Rhizobiaceae bacterium]|nr:hypothetical protein [Rhizobiaceae bacterium]
MNSSILFFVISGLWGLAMIVNFVDAVRLSYAVENRSGVSGRQKYGIPTYANIWRVVLNKGIAQDEETQELRRQMNRRLMIIAGGFLFFIMYVTLAGPNSAAA